jgi:hypothetical protein
VVYAPWKGAGRALYPCGVLRPVRAQWLVSPTPVVSPPANILSPSRDRLFPLRSRTSTPWLSHGRIDPLENDQRLRLRACEKAKLKATGHQARRH